jgi:hypothetical protein
MDKCYKPSGRFSISSILYFLFITTTVFPVLGLVYAYAIWYIPFIYINFLIAGGFGFLVGFSLNMFVIGKGKVRSPLLAIVFGILGGFVAMYFHYAVWLDLVLNAGESYGSSRMGITVSNIKLLQVFYLAGEPAILFQLIKEVNSIGTWGLFGSNAVSGIALSIIWIIEFLIITVLSVFISIGKASDPFCEVDNDWFKESELPPFNYITSDELIINLDKGAEDSFTDLALSANLNESHSVFTLFTSNHGDNFLSIENKFAKLDDDGKLDFDTSYILNNIRLSKTLKESLLQKSVSKVMKPDELLVDNVDEKEE